MSLLLLAIISVCAVVPVDSRSREQDQMVMQVLSRWDSVQVDTLPPTDGGGPMTVTVGYSLYSLNDVSKKGYTEMTGLLSLAWNDPRLTFNTRNVQGVEQVRVPPSSIWTPDLQLYNAIRPGTKVLTRKPQALIARNGDVILINSISTRAACDVTGQLESQNYVNCTLKFGSWTYLGSDLDLQLSDSEPLSDYALTGQWNVTAVSTKRNVVFYSCCPEPYVDVTYTFRLQKRQ